MTHSQPETAKAIIARIRQVAVSGQADAGQQVLAGLDELEAAFSDLVAEDEDMAEELLRAYEQLGIVFDITSRLPTVREETQVLLLFIECLETTYSATRITTYEPGDRGIWLSRIGGPTPPQWACDAMEQGRSARQVIVAERPSDDPSQPAPVGPGRGASGRGLVQVMCAPIFAGDDFVCSLALGRDCWIHDDSTVRSFDAGDMQLLGALTTFCGDLIRNFRLGGQLRELSTNMVNALVNAIDQKDPYTSGHSHRVARFALMLSEQVGLNSEDRQMLHWAALLHDVGKIGIRDEVLKKTGKLTTDEFEHIKEHPVRSYDVVCEVPQLARALDGVVYHHEHWDGGGYPCGLAGDEIPLQARVLQVADIFDALTSNRSYRRAFGWEEALEILNKEAGTTVDPNLVPCFERMVRRLIDEQPEVLREISDIGRLESRSKFKRHLEQSPELITAGVS